MENQVTVSNETVTETKGFFASLWDGIKSGTSSALTTVSETVADTYTTEEGVNWKNVGYTVAGVALTAGVVYGGKKAYDHFTNEDSEDKHVKAVKAAKDFVKDMQAKTNAKTNPVKEAAEEVVQAVKPSKTESKVVKAPEDQILDFLKSDPKIYEAFQNMQRLAVEAAIESMIKTELGSDITE